MWELIQFILILLKNFYEPAIHGMKDTNVLLPTDQVKGAMNMGAFYHK